MRRISTNQSSDRLKENPKEGPKQRQSTKNDENTVFDGEGPEKKRQRSRPDEPQIRELKA